MAGPESVVRNEDLAPLLAVVARASLGDFSGELPLPKGRDELAELTIGINLMLQVIRDNLAELKALNADLESRVQLRTQDLAKAKQDAEQRARELEATLSHMVGRETKMIELKKEIERLKARAAGSS